MFIGRILETDSRSYFSSVYHFSFFNTKCGSVSEEDWKGTDMRLNLQLYIYSLETKQICRHSEILISLFYDIIKQLFRYRIYKGNETVYLSVPLGFITYTHINILSKSTIKHECVIKYIMSNFTNENNSEVILFP